MPDQTDLPENMQAVTSADFVSFVPKGDSEKCFQWLEGRRRNDYSQYGEDGIVDAIFERLDPVTSATGKDGGHWVCEVGAGDGVFLSNARHLILDGWNALLIERDAGAYDRLKETYYHTERVRAELGTVAPTGENRIEAFLERNGVPPDFDLLVLDIDGQDYHVLNSLIRYKPRVVMVEFDPHVPPMSIPPLNGEGQAGFEATARLLIARGYTPILMVGVNLIAVRYNLVWALKGETAPKAPPGSLRWSQADPFAGFPDRKLNLGAGTIPVPGYVNLDRTPPDEIPDGIVYVQGDAYPLNSDLFPAESLDEIRASHLFEHFDGLEALAALEEWRRALKPGGLLKIAVPDFERIARDYLDGKEINVQGFVMGGHVDANDYHKQIYDEECLSETLRLAGFTDVKRWEGDYDDCSRFAYTLNLQGTKGEGPDPGPDSFAVPIEDIRRDVAPIMTAPRLSWTDFCAVATSVFSRLGLNVPIAQGVFWGQCLTRMMEEHAPGKKYLLTLDYDTIFSLSDVAHLYALMEAHPEVDALFPVQMRRGPDTMALFTLDDGEGGFKKRVTGADIAAEVIPARSGHFGLTMIRTSVLEKMEKPWIIGKPDADGGWGDGRVDDDLVFWEKLRAAGGTVALARNVAVGHLQVMVTWPDKRMREMFQQAADYGKTGKPAEAWP